MSECFLWRLKAALFFATEIRNLPHRRRHGFRAWVHRAKVGKKPDFLQEIQRIFIAKEEICAHSVFLHAMEWKQRS